MRCKTQKRLINNYRTTQKTNVLQENVTSLLKEEKDFTQIKCVINIKLNSTQCVFNFEGLRRRDNDFDSGASLQHFTLLSLSFLVLLVLPRIITFDS